MRELLAIITLRSGSLNALRTICGIGDADAGEKADLYSAEERVEKSR